MREGMLWFDDEKQVDMKDKVSKAINFFQSKYGQLPRACYVHPLSLDKEIILDESIKVYPNTRMIKNHIWLEFPEE